MRKIRGVVADIRGKAVIAGAVLAVLLLAVPACIQPGASGMLILADDFSNPDSGWETYNTPRMGSAAYVKGEYTLTVLQKISFLPVSLYNVGDIDNYAVEVEARCTDAKIDGSTAGIYFGRRDKHNLYYYLVKPSGEYSINHLAANDWSPVVPETPCAAINRDNASNRLRLDVQGARVTPYINGNALPAVGIPDLTRGQPGLAIESALFIPRSYTFDNFKLFDLPAASGAGSPSQSELLAGKTLVPIYEDDFSQCGAWKALQNVGKVECGNGALKVHSAGKGAAVAIYKNGWQVTDFMAEVDVRQVSGDQDDYGGIIFRFNGQKGLVFGVNSSEYMLLRLPGTTDFVRPWKKSAYIKPAGETNRIKIICAGKMIEVYANGNRLGAFSDESSLSGLLLLGISGNSGADVSYIYDNFRLYQIQ